MLSFEERDRHFPSAGDTDAIGRIGKCRQMKNLGFFWSAGAGRASTIDGDAVRHLARRKDGRCRASMHTRFVATNRAVVLPTCTVRDVEPRSTRSMRDGDDMTGATQGRHACALRGGTRLCVMAREDPLCAPEGYEGTSRNVTRRPRTSKGAVTTIDGSSLRGSKVPGYLPGAERGSLIFSLNPAKYLL